MATALNICDNGIPFVTLVRQTEPSKRTNPPAFPRPLFKGRRSAMAFVLGKGCMIIKRSRNLLALLVLLFPISVAAQQTPKLEVFGGYSYLRLTEVLQQ